jgi:hypothetical protein
VGMSEHFRYGLGTNLESTFEKIGFEINVKDVSAQTLYRIVEWQDVYTLSVFDIQSLMDMDEITELDSQVVASDFVHLDSTILYVIGAHTDKDGVSSFFAAVERLVKSWNERMI